MPTNGGIIGPVNLPVGNQVTSITASANFTVSAQNTTSTGDVMVVAGGGGGQNNAGNGGAGAGGFRLFLNQHNKIIK